ncbi:MAG: HlyD family efflux transporter periplasmic adaptor subunit [Candidatus Sumerlaeota bacterium]|nr:HlyD family efflux transporter periplasmic adaptor subunit [Candidatus Sumerlaeota bacterium]
MKIQFKPDDRTQSSVSEAQVAMREAPIRKRPVLPYLIVFAILAAATGLGYWIWRSYSVHTYGMVSSRAQELRASHAGKVQGLSLHCGDCVKKGDLLFRLVVQPSEKEEQVLRVMTAQLASQSSATRALAEQKKQFNIQQAQAEVDRAKALIEQESRLARAEVERLSALYAQEEASHRAILEKSRIEVVKLSEVLDARRQRVEKLETLLKMDAAVASDVEAPRNEMRLAQRNLEQAQADLKLTERKANPYEQPLAAARAVLEQTEKKISPQHFALQRALSDLQAANQDVVNIEGIVQQAEIEMALARNMARSTEYRAAFDGIVAELKASDDVHVEPGALIATLLDKNNLWVDAYVPASRIGILKAGRAATIFVPGAPGAIHGKVVNSANVMEALPQVLAQKMPGAGGNALLARIEIPDTTGLIPGCVVQVVIGTGNR